MCACGGGALLGSGSGSGQGAAWHLPLLAVQAAPPPFKELIALAKVDHPNIVKYYETYEDNFFIYLCMELMEGGVLIEDDD